MEHPGREILARTGDAPIMSIAVARASLSAAGVAGGTAAFNTRVSTASSSVVRRA